MSLAWIRLVPNLDLPPICSRTSSNLLLYRRATTYTLLNPLRTSTSSILPLAMVATLVNIRLTDFKGCPSFGCIGAPCWRILRPLETHISSAISMVVDAEGGVVSVERNVIGDSEGAESAGALDKSMENDSLPAKQYSRGKERDGSTTESSHRVPPEGVCWGKPPRQSARAERSTKSHIRQLPLNSNPARCIRLVDV
ncbi:hypothetical protein BU15DRAFT_66449 [Melanogaster broomeanus]|nr:hypothetical protein BU15DRAFT_66449 [Melanogaster broomeanus]